MENNFNDVCLWVQAESINDNDIVIKDGRILPSGNEHQKLSTYAIAIQSNYERIGEECKDLSNTPYRIYDHVKPY